MIPSYQILDRFLSYERDSFHTFVKGPKAMQVSSVPTSSIEFLTLPSGRVLEIEAFGTGEPVLLLPGLGCTSALFALAIPYLSAQHRFIMINPRGMAASDVAHEDYEVEDLAIDALFAMNKLGYPCFHVAGVSLGGFVGQALVALVPWRVKSLVLISSSRFGEGFKPLPEIKDQDLVTFYDLDPKKRAWLSVDATVHPSLKEERPDHYQQVLELRTHTRMNAEQVIYQNRAAKRYLKRKDISAQPQCPTLILSGANDRFVPLENAQHLSHLIEGAKLVVIPKSDHLVILERPDLCALAMNEFWEGLK
jgi:3-oxoadipate enol-lactonase